MSKLSAVVNKPAFASVFLGLAQVGAMASPASAQNSETSTSAAVSTLAQRIDAEEEADASVDPSASLARRKLLLEEALTPDSPDPRSVGRVHHLIGQAYFHLGDVEQAFSAFQPAEASLAEAGEAARADLIKVRSDLAVIYNYKGEHEKARKNFLDALAFWEEKAAGKPHLELATALNNVAASELEQGNLAAALDYNQRATDMALSLDPVPVDTPVWLANRIVYLYQAGQTDAAIAAGRDGLAKMREILPADHPSNGNMLANMASLLYRQGRPNDALDFARRAFEVQEKAAGAPTQNSAAIRSIYASALIAKGDYADAITFLDAALPILVEQLGAESDRTLLARTYRATALSQLGRYDEALAEQRAVALISDSKLPEFHRDRAGSYIGLASIALRADRLDIAREAVAQAVALQSQALVAEHPDVLATKAMALAIDSRLQLRSAAELTREAKALLLVMQRNLSLSQNGTIGQRERATFAYLAEVLLRAGEDLETSFLALQYVAFSRLDSIPQPDTPTKDLDQKDADLVRQYADLRSQRSALLDAASSRIGNAKAEFSLADDVAAVAEIDRKMASAEQQIKTAGLTRYLPVQTFEPLAVADVHAALSESSALLMAAELNDQIAVFYVDADQSVAVLSELSAQDAKAYVDRIRTSVNPLTAAQTKFDEAAAQKLYDGLLGALPADLLAERSELYYVANGALDALPFSLLSAQETGPDGQAASHFLIDKIGLAQLPSVQFLKRAGRTETLGNVELFLGIGAASSGKNDYQTLASRSASDARLVADLPALSASDAELRDLAAIIGGRKSALLLGPDATETAISAMVVPPESIIAFATHGLVSGELEGLKEPALLVAPDDQSDGLLTVSEIARLSLPAEWVILSACNSAASIGPDDPGLSGLAEAFMRAGGRHILATHWIVQDDIASLLTVETLKFAGKGFSAPQSLQRAIASVRARSDGALHPAFWAPFMVIGR